MRCPSLLFSAILVALAVLTSSCVDITSIDDLDPNARDVFDEELPEAAVLGPEMPLEVGSLLQVEASDDSGVRRLAVFFTDEDGQVIWASDTINAHDVPEGVFDIPVTELPSTFPYGEPVNAVAWAQDRVGKERLQGAPEDNPLSMAAASGTSVTVYEGRTFRVSSGTIGDIVHNFVDHQIYYTNIDGNYVGIFDLFGMAMTDYRIMVGSRPNMMAFRPFAYGPGPTLAVFNSGGTEVSIVDITSREGGYERWRIVMPIIEAEVGSEEIILDTDVSSIMLQCNSVVCNEPTLYIGSPRLGGTGAGLVRSLAVTSPRPTARFSVLTPTHSPVLEADESVTVTADEISRLNGSRSRLFERENRSRCGTLAFGAAILASSHEVDGSFFIAETGEAGQSCDRQGGVRILRFDPDGDGQHIVSHSSIVNFDYDANLQDGGIQGIDVNDDASVVVIHTANTIYVTDGQLRRLATIPLDGVRAVSFLAGHTGGPGPVEEGAVFVADTNDGMVIFETQHFTEVTRYHTAGTSRGHLEFVPVDDRGNLAIFGVNSDADGLIVLETSIQDLVFRSNR